MAIVEPKLSGFTALKKICAIEFSHSMERITHFTLQVDNICSQMVVSRLFGFPQVLT